MYFLTLHSLQKLGQNKTRREYRRLFRIAALIIAVVFLPQYWNCSNTILPDQALALRYTKINKAGKL